MVVNMKDTNWNDLVMKFGSFLTAILLARAYIPRPWLDAFHLFVTRYTDKLSRYFSPYTEVVFEEYAGERFHRNKVFSIIEMYLSECTSMKAKRLKASFVKDGKALVLGLGDNEEVTDKFRGVKLWWRARKYQSKSQTISFYPGSDEKRYYRLTFHGRHRQLVTESYLNHVLEEGKAIAVKRRQRKLFTNIKSDSSPHKSNLWSSVEFKHPATFDTLAMEPTRKQAIIDDLVRFTEAKDYYKKIGKPWKRGYLLFGPPGTGKSTMISAMANLLEYDVYDLELTAVSDNTQLRRLLIDTSNKSIIVIEDIDCSLDLTGQRASSKDEKEKDDRKEEKNLIEKKLKEGSKSKQSEVTLSGLLNFIDGLWSACGDERLIIFTTNYVEKLDPALIRTGRMDMHIELWYCCYESFKVLARNYLDVEDHPLFENVRMLLEEVNMTPADVAESLMPKSLRVDVEACLGNLVKALEKAKKDGKLKKVDKESSEVKEEEESSKVEEVATILEEDKKEQENKDI